MALGVLYTAAQMYQVKSNNRNMCNVRQSLIKTIMASYIPSPTAEMNLCGRISPLLLLGGQIQY